VSAKPPLPDDLLADIDRLAPQLTLLDHYRVLGVDASASDELLKAAYLRMLQRYHPGRWHARESRPHQKRMEAIFARATEAYQVLCDPDRKREYDRALALVRGERVAPAAPAPPRPAMPPSDPSRPLVLVVEDDEALRRMLVRILAELGTVVAASDGREALDLLASAERLPSLVVTDLMMPRLDGLELARRMKADAKTRSIPIVMLTAKQGAKDVVEGVNAGARVYLTKPFKVDELKAKAKKAMGPSR